MLDIRFIREHPDTVQRAAEAKGLGLSVRELLDVDGQRLRLLREVEQLRHKRNAASSHMATLIRDNHRVEAETLKQHVKTVNATLADSEAQLAKIEEKFRALMLLVPNIISPDTPVGQSDADNVEIRRVGQPPVFNFPALHHVMLAESLGMLDVPRGIKVGGSRGYFLTNAGLKLHRAVQELAIDLLYRRGYKVMEVPLMVREETLINTGFFPTGRDQTYHISKDDLWLVGTSEVPLVSFYANEVVNVDEPLRLAGVSTCFRREAGSAGRDVHGLYRVHQFSKVEQVIVCKNDVAASMEMFAEITQNAEEILKLLELPYRVVAVCTGDLSQKNYLQYDIETWMPSRASYGETHSSSVLLDFQARRSNIRYREKNGALQYCHTLNNTAVASPRILIPLLENHQRADKSVYLPKALRPYMDGLEELRPVETRQGPA